MGSLSQEYLPSLSRQSESDSRTWTMLLAGVVSVVHCHGDQTSREETSRASHPNDGARNAGASRAIVEGVTRRKYPQYRLYRAVEWNPARAAGLVDSQMSSCSTPN